MEQDKMIEKNRNGWNQLVANNKSYSNASLPEYGPFMSNEDKYQLFKEVSGKIVLELGCASGKSLKYLSEKGALEVWGVDISLEQINKAQKLNIVNSKFFIAPMEDDIGLPNDYFDYVIALYSLGYSSEPVKTIELVSNYLKSGGKFIISWTHPFFNSLSIEDDKVTVRESYINEKYQLIKKGVDKIELMQRNLKISTIVNGLIKNGLEIDEIIEEDPIDVNKIEGYNSPYWDERKLKIAPTTILIVAHKK